MFGPNFTILESHDKLNDWFDLLETANKFTPDTHLGAGDATNGFKVL
jgi:hypothetical protein